FGINSANQIVGDSLSLQGTLAFLYQNGRMTDLGTLDPLGLFSEAFGINSAGQIVGDSLLISNLGTADHAFLYQNGPMTDLGTLGGISSAASGINIAGQIVGDSYTSSGSDHAFLYQNGGMIDLNDLTAGSGWTLIHATAINDSDQIVGSGTNPQELT